MTSALEQRIQLIEDQIAIKGIVDTFSNLADVKDIDTQMTLFSDDAVVETYFGDTLFASMKGRKEIGSVFSNFIANFEIMYHMNGQCVVEVDGDTATSEHYCIVLLVSDDQGKKMQNFNGVTYRDEYARVDGKWLITKRVSKFVWRNISDMVVPA